MGRGSKFEKNSVTYFMDGPIAVKVGVVQMGIEGVYDQMGQSRSV